MNAISEFTNVYLHREPVDMRKAINGLAEIVAHAKMGELFGASLFVFTGKRRDSIKVLYFDRSGFALWQKRLERDRFPWPRKFPESVVSITPEQLAWLLDGIDVWKLKPFETLSYERVI
jgi:transposase